MRRLSLFIFILVTLIIEFGLLGHKRLLAQNINKNTGSNGRVADINRKNSISGEKAKGISQNGQLDSTQDFAENSDYPIVNEMNDGIKYINGIHAIQKGDYIEDWVCNWLDTNKNSAPFAKYVLKTKYEFIDMEPGAEIRDYSLLSDFRDIGYVYKTRKTWVDENGVDSSYITYYAMDADSLYVPILLAKPVFLPDDAGTLRLSHAIGIKDTIYGRWYSWGSSRQRTVRVGVTWENLKDRINNRDLLAAREFFGKCDDCSYAMDFTEEESEDEPKYEFTGVSVYRKGILTPQNSGVWGWIDCKYIWSTPTEAIPQPDLKEPNLLRILRAYVIAYWRLGGVSYSK